MKIFTIVLSGLTTIILVVEFVEKIRKFWGTDAVHISGYFLAHMPKIISTVTPVAVLLSVLLFFGILKKNGELIPLRSSGMSNKRIALPIIVSAAIITVILVLSNLHFIPAMNRKAIYIKEVLIEKRTSRSLFNQNFFWFKDQHGTIYNIKRIDTKKKRLLGLTAYNFDPNGELINITNADEAVYTDTGWILHSGNIKQFNPDKTVTLKTFTEKPLSLAKTMKDFKGMEKKTERLDYNQLKEYAARLKKDGYNASMYKVEQYNKIAFPMVTLVITLIAIPIGIKGGVRTGLSVGIGKGIAITFSYWLIHAISLALGNGGVLPPMLAAWTANTIFLLTGAYLFLDIEY